MKDAPIAILFDIDGTLISSGGAGTRAWALAFDELYGTKVDISKFSDLGMTDPEVGALSFEGLVGRRPRSEELDEMLERHVHYLAKTVADSPGYKVLEGVEDLLLDLIKHGRMLGLVSGNSMKGAHIKLNRANLNRFFSFGGFGSDSADRGELTKAAISRAEISYGGSLPMDRVIAVGDTIRDVEAAHTAGIRCVGVATSKFSTEDLLAAGADFAVGSLRNGLPF